MKYWFYNAGFSNKPNQVAGLDDYHDSFLINKSPKLLNAIKKAVKVNKTFKDIFEISPDQLKPKKFTIGKYELDFEPVYIFSDRLHEDIDYVIDFLDEILDDSAYYESEMKTFAEGGTLFLIITNKNPQKFENKNQLYFIMGGENYGSWRYSWKDGLEGIIDQIVKSFKAKIEKE